MGKKSSQLPKKPHTHQLNTLIKALRPKVHITHSSNFKTLVQKLTGNGSPSPMSLPTAPPVLLPQPAHMILIDEENNTSPNLGPSPGPGLDNSFVPFDYDYASSEALGMQQQLDHVMNHVNDIELRNLESWLLDFDPLACIHDGPFAPMNTYGYDHNLAPIM